ncbi:hypothetical protein AYI68_g6205 [Smittium mucronatum]|uniref:Uncharacterized protein n=1 Tax=Smittium mucronatum TaxID=133383 RepID=A0A1R0GS64_9FUNG|nr:hypothetical protein AYI68_g6205 [Smittium mucronatum]
MRFEYLRQLAFAAALLSPALAQLDKCSSASETIAPQSINSSSIAKNYNSAIPITLPCDVSSHDFSVTLNIQSDGDFFVAFADSAGLYSSNGVVQVQVGLASTRNSVSRGRISPPQKRSHLGSPISSLVKRAVDASITYSYSNSVLTVFKNDVLIITYAIKNFDISQLFVSSSTGTASIISGGSTCIPTASASSVCPNIDDCTATSPVPCVFIESDIVGTVFDPTTYIQIPCSGSSFTFTASVTADSDLFISILGPDDFDGTFYQGSIGIVSALSQMGLGQFTVADPNAAYAFTAVSATISFEYDATTTAFKTYINSAQVSEILIPNWNFNNLAFSAYNGIATISGGSFSCVYSNGCPS